ncbi:aldose epimerase family protein [Jannaschia sp. R86511]|uniref:aldose epimerase family protein n=1 Tax=Jannaschia sp. R86511 TaxID=3093853 RepID=UPI0036D3F7A7
MTAGATVPAGVTEHVVGRGPVRLHVSTYGAAVHRLRLLDGRGPEDVALGHAGLPEYVAERDFCGATVGRFANRLRAGRFELDGRRFQVPTDGAAAALHGGPDGFDRRVWRTERADDDEVVLSLHSPDGDQGFPGALDVRVAFRVEGSVVRIGYEYRSDAATVVNLTNHTHVDLSGEGGDGVDGHLLQVPATHVTEVDTDLLPTGRLLAVAGTPLDLRAARPLRDVVRAVHPLLVAARGLDLDYRVDGWDPASTDLRPVARLEHPGTGRVLEVASDRPGVQVYTGNFFDGSTVGRSGRLLRQGAGVALETQLPPDAPNQPGFPSAVLRPGQVGRTATTWTFSA